jgi:DNA-binding transcriptional ArsR family regulator
MTTNTSSKILQYLQEKSSASAKELADYLGISKQALFKQLAKLIGTGQISKMGTPPKVAYFLKAKELPALFSLNSETKKIIEQNYLLITPAGERKEGLAGFIYWCQKNNLPIEKTAAEYKNTLSKYDVFKKDSLISGLDKLKNTFGQAYVDELYYLDFYSIERFGKTKLGQLLLYAKQSQNKKLIRELSDALKPKILSLLNKYKIDAVGFIPPSVKREVQFLKEFERNLNLTIPKLEIIKIKGDIIVPQKTLNKLSDRIENAQKSIIVRDTRQYKNILLIDDAVGSGASINETAAQIRTKNLSSGKIIGLALTGSFKGFDVISEA